MEEAGRRHLGHMHLHAQLTVEVDAKIANYIYWLQNVSADDSGPAGL